jgi:hypothetical protein
MERILSLPWLPVMSMFLLCHWLDALAGVRSCALGGFPVINTVDWEPLAPRATQRACVQAFLWSIWSLC